MAHDSKREFQSILGPALETAVWMWRIEMAHLSIDRLIAIAKECAAGDLGISYLGDVLQFYQKGRTRLAFNALAKGIAAASLVDRADNWEDRVARLDASFAQARREGYG